MGERIQKVLARSGIGSRRAVEQWIQTGSVRVNGQPATIGQQLDRDDRVQVGDRIYRAIAEHPREARWLRYHKPQGRVSTRSDPEGRPTVFDVLPRLPEGRGRWVALGRLDVNTSGLMLFTDDGELANALTHPSAEVEREYAVRVRGRVDGETLARLTEGIELEDGPAHFDRVIDVGGEGSNHWYHVVLHEGRRNEVRRIWEAVGCQVARLTRVRFGPVTLPRSLRPDRFEDLPPGDIEALTAGIRKDVESGTGKLRLEAWQGRHGGRAGAKKKRVRGNSKSPRRRRQ